jgi:hypothetical protein
MPAPSIPAIDTSTGTPRPRGKPLEEVREIRDEIDRRIHALISDLLLEGVSTAF